MIGREGGQLRPRLLTAAIVALLGLTLLINLVYVYLCGDGLTRYGDDGSEACVVRAGERFAREGFRKNYGLADPTYGNRFPNDGITGPSGARPDDPIYHGYPPGSEWLGGLYTMWLGEGRLRLFRIFPVTFFVISAAIFLSTLARTIGPWRACFVYLGCLLTPMFTRFTHGLYYQGYALGLLLIQISLVMKVVRTEGRPRSWAGILAALFLMGFIQGYLSFDYCVVTTFAAVPIAFMLTPESRPIRMGSLLAMCVAPGLGFTLAHVLHFAQSVAYLGGLQPALDEYAFRAKKTYGAKYIVEGHSRIYIYTVGLLHYARAYLRWNHLFGIAGEALLAALAILTITRQVTFGLGRRGFEAIMTPPTRRELAGMAAALLVGVGWLFVKPAHAINHLPFVGCHLFLFQSMGWLIIAQHTSLRVPTFAGEPEPDAAVAVGSRWD
jgi:hypothetical protein